MKKTARCLPALVALVTLAGAASASAATNLLTNGSFENYNASTGTFNGWTSTSSVSTNPSQITTDGSTRNVNGDVVSPDPFTFSPDGAGTHALYFVDDNASESLSQSITLVAGQKYEVGFDLFKTVSGASNPNGFTVSGSFAGVTVTNASSTSLQTGVWTHFSGIYTAIGNTYSSFVLNFTAGAAAAQDVLVDQAYVTAVPPAAVPEPASFVVLGAGLLGLYAVRRRHQTQ